MPTQVIVYVLTALAAVVVVLTRLRLRRQGAAGRTHTGSGLLTVHTVVGVLALVTWVVFLVFPEDTFLGSATVGIIALAFWWVEVVVGLLILVRWMPSRGRHAAGGTTDRWAGGPWLSVLAHVGMAAAVVVFTLAYLTSDV